MTLKITERLFVIPMKVNAKFEEELTCRFKTGMKDLTTLMKKITGV